MQAKGFSSALHAVHQSNGVFYQIPRAAVSQGSASCSSCAPPSFSGPHNAFQGAERRENKDNMYYTGRHRPGRTEPAPSGGASRKAGHHSFIHLWWARARTAGTHSFIHLWWAWAQLSLGLRLLLKEVPVLLLLQLSVIPLYLPIGLFHIIIHELVHEWVKIGLVPKEVNKLCAIVKVACR